jgi:AraC-like DNA-binding protein
LLARTPRLLIGDHRSALVRTEQEFVARSLQAGRPIADVAFRRAHHKESRIAGYRLGDLALGVVSSGPMKMKTFEAIQLTFLIPFQGSGTIVEGAKSLRWCAPGQIIRSTYCKPLEYTTEVFSAVSISPNVGELADAIREFSPAARVSMDRLLESGTLGFPGVVGGVNYLEALMGLISVANSIDGNADLMNRIGFESVITRVLAEMVVAQDGIPASSEESKAAPRSQRAIDLICEHVERNIGRPLTIPQMEKLSGMTGRSLNYAFQSRFNCSPQQWQRNFLLAEARYKLFSEDQNASIKKIAFELGFSSSNSFSSHYKRRFGEYPSETIARRHPNINDQPASDRQAQESDARKAGGWNSSARQHGA